IYTDEQLAVVMSPGIVRTAAEAAKIVVAVYAAPTAGKMMRTNSGVRNSLSLGEESTSLLRQILRSQAQKTILVAMGNPYLAKDFPEVQNYLCTFSAAQVSEVSTAKALFGELEIRGHLPVSIPGIAARGTGLLVPAVQ